MKKSLYFSVLVEQDEDGVYVASVPTLRGRHTQAKNLENLWPRIREAIELCLEGGVTSFTGIQMVVLQSLSCWRRPGTRNGTQYPEGHRAFQG